MSEINGVINKEELKSGYQDFLTVGKLKKFLKEHNLPDHAKVMIQRVEDIYFEKNHWDVYLKEGERSYSYRQWNKDIQNEEYLNERPKLKEAKEDLHVFTEEEIRGASAQYHPAWSCVRYKGEGDLLFIDLHY